MTLRALPEPRILAAAALLACASLFLVYRWHFTARADAAAGLGTLSDMLRVEADAGPQARAPAGGTAGASVPDLLSQAQMAASQYHVAIRSVTPNPSDAKRLVLGVHGDYRDLMLFLGRLETFQITLNGFDFAPDESGATGTIDITFAGKPGAPVSFADYLEAILKYSAVRNPFEIGDPIPLPNTAPVLGDLTWTYHLSSIWQVGAERLATIDGHDYRPGDTINGMQIVAIGPSGVRLRAPGQALIRQLHFRHNPGTADHG
jgi:hypothetical protein